MQGPKRAKRGLPKGLTEFRNDFSFFWLRQRSRDLAVGFTPNRGSLHRADGSDRGKGESWGVWKAEDLRARQQPLSRWKPTGATMPRPAAPRRAHAPPSGFTAVACGIRNDNSSNKLLLV